MVNRDNEKGFTLAELLIVVAIIAVLVAISIPIFVSQLRKARLATNQANARAGYASAVAAQFDSDVTDDSCSYTYDVSTAVATKDIKPATSDGDTETFQARDIASWTVDTVWVDDGIALGDQVAPQWSIIFGNGHEVDSIVPIWE